MNGFEWWELAWCKGREALYYKDSPSMADLDAMRTICFSCAVLDDCERAGAAGDFGEQFYAGRTADEHGHLKANGLSIKRPTKLYKQNSREREAIRKSQAVVLDLLVLDQVDGEKFADIIDAFCQWTVEGDPNWTYEDAQERAFLLYERLQAKLEAA